MMNASGSRIPKFPSSAGLFKRPNESTVPTIEKKRVCLDIPSQPSNTTHRLQRMHSTLTMKDGFSEAAKKRAVSQPERSTNIVRESAPALRRKISAVVSPCPAKKTKRPAWDLKGRMLDMESTNTHVMDKLHMCTERIMALEKDKNELDQDVKIKSVLSQEATATVEKLEAQLKEKTEELESSVQEKNIKIQELQSCVQSLTADNTILKTEVSSLKQLVTTLTSTQHTLQAELDATKIKNEKQEQLIAKLSSENGMLQAKIGEKDSSRRKLHNIVQKLKGNIRVFCRVRPSLHNEVRDNLVMSNISIKPDNKTLEIARVSDSATDVLDKSRQSYEFSFDLVFNQTSSQDIVFLGISELVQSALDGCHVCIFTYGQTGSGKTYTMEGPENVTSFIMSSEDNRLGIIPRSVHQIFATTQELEAKGWKYKMDASFMEIYNENIRDMLVDNSHNSAPKCEIKRTATKGNDDYISNITTVTVTCPKQVSDLLQKARANRAVAATNCNERSSRSHYIFQIKLLGENEITGEKCEGILNLIDLAGSERVKESLAGDRLTEAKNINKSLSNLGNVIMALSQKADHIPYRNSKLTHLLMNSLSRQQAKTLLFVNISPCDEHFSETVNSLQFATKVKTSENKKGCPNNPWNNFRKKYVLSDYEIQKYGGKNEALREIWSRMSTDEKNKFLIQ